MWRPDVLAHVSADEAGEGTEHASDDEHEDDGFDHGAMIGRCASGEGVNGHRTAVPSDAV
jgi:hypothetical protein